MRKEYRASVSANLLIKIRFCQDERDGTALYRFTPAGGSGSRPGGGAQRLRLRLGAQHEDGRLVLVLELLPPQLPHVQTEARRQKGPQPTEFGREGRVQRGARGVGGVGERGERGAKEVVTGELVDEKVLRM